MSKNPIDSQTIFLRFKARNFRFSTYEEYDNEIKQQRALLEGVMGWGRVFTGRVLTIE